MDVNYVSTSAKERRRDMADLSRAYSYMQLISCQLYLLTEVANSAKPTSDHTFNF